MIVMDIPEGWQLVPIEPTGRMMEAYRRAIFNHVESLPPKLRERAKAQPHGLRVKAKTKLRLRWAAMLAAAPRAKGGAEL